MRKKRRPATRGGRFAFHLTRRGKNVGEEDTRGRPADRELGPAGLVLFLLGKLLSCIITILPSTSICS
jgi:hypothetical protein